MLRRYFTASLLVLLFIFTQQSLLAHEISHINEPASHSQKHDKAKSNLCEKCLGLNHLDNLINSKGFCALSTSATSLHIAGSQQTYFEISPSSYKARAPPSIS